MGRYTLQQRIEIVKFSTKMHENKPEFNQKIITSDKAHFHLGGYVNKQNCRVWRSENPKMIIEMPLYPKRVTVWGGF